MVDKNVVNAVQAYLRAVQKKGVPVSYGVLFGSYARSQQHAWSDIDLLVVSPRYDRTWTQKDWAKLWRIAASTDVRIEPIPVGERQYKEDDSSLIIEVARREGQIIPLAE
ncbi:MAG: nucleotidyltransferase domain-containing protein [Anaerolineales bacterium]|jgi:predicted nucleotidyltransferase|nr:nucleotidyltransferase domain-containing protein [Anaerolineales bacterium]MCC6986182.1 nucleotidyltransferase domain-containing protein [Anaerolineales bacterium]